MFFLDQHGKYRSGTTQNTMVLKNVDGILHSTKFEWNKKDKLFEDRIGQPLSPNECSNLITVHYVVQTHKKDANIKKKNTYVLKAPSGFEALENACLVEYGGPKKSDKTSLNELHEPHGNARNTQQPYVRTNPLVIQEIVKLIKQSLPNREIYEKQRNPFEPSQGVRKTQTIKDQRKKFSDPKGSLAQQVSKIVEEYVSNTGHKIVQKVFYEEPGKPPIIILYEDHMIDSIRANCTSKALHPSVLGCDRTFDVSLCFVTQTAFLNRNLKRTRTQNNPAQYGPVMLHWDGAESAYKRFFSVIKEEVGASFAVELTGKKLLPKHLQDDAVENENEEDPDVVEEGDILFGSDEEKAMCSAAEKVFGRGKFFRCTLHIEKNIKRHLRRTSTKKMNDIVYRWVHAPNAVTKAMSKADFEKAVLEIDQTVFDPRFFKKLVCTTWTYIVWPRLETKCIPFNWKNNMTEALNRVIKLYIDWNPECLIEIIDIFPRLFTKQY